MLSFRWMALVALMLVSWMNTCHAAREDKFEPLYRKMQQAGENYRQARIKLSDGDNNGMLQMSKSLEDMEDLASQCFKQKACDGTKMITFYESLLKSTDMNSVDNEPGLGSDNAQSSTILSQSDQARRAMTLFEDVDSFGKMIEFNEPVQAAIKDWLTQQRSFLIDAWENYQYMRYLTSPEYEKAGLPEALLFGIMAKESGGRVHSISSAGASGPLQFMYGTGQRFGLGRDATGFDTRFDPQFAARANAQYVNERFAELNRNIEMTVAAYNGGEGRASRIFKQTGGKSFWSPEVYNQWPAETRDYVPKVIAAAWLFLHPKKYGLVFPKIDTTPDQFSLVRSASIFELTICMGNGDNRDGWFRVLRNLNPRYEADAYIPQGTVLRAPKRAVAMYRQHCLQGPRAEVAAQLMRASKLPPMPVYLATSAVTPVSGQSTTVVSPDNQSLAEQIAAASTSSAAEIKKTDAKKIAESNKIAEAKKAQDRKKPEPKAKQYRVKKGDSLMAIARIHNCDITELAKGNKLRAPGYTILPGQKLQLKGCDG
jgi:membrane-bound lytic murein transglycosylase D